MPLFSSKKSDTKISQSQFVSDLHATPAYKEYVTKFKSGAAQAMALAIYDTEAKRHDPDGYWASDVTLTPNDFTHAAPAGSVIKLREKDVKAFHAKVKFYLDVDMGEFDLKKKYVARLKTDAASGALRKKLHTQAEPESNYYTTKRWNDMSVQEKKAAWPPPSAPKDDDVDKIKAWLNFTKTGPAALGLVDAHAKNGTWPLGTNDTLVSDVFNKVVSGPPLYRLPVLGSYPSSIAARILLRESLGEIASQANGLRRGKDAWQDFALCAFGTVMAVQGFPDGNKRTARVVYGIVMASAGIPFRAPNSILGQDLAKM
jgi:hypothetical protein